MKTAPDSVRTEPRLALITGSARRVGAVIAETLHARGWTVFIHYRQSEAEASALAARLNALRPDSACILQADLNQPAAPRQLAERLLALTGGRLDALINNASSFYPTPAGSATLAQWDDLFASNARAPFFLSQALTPALAACHGSIVNIVDIHASRPFRDYPVYCMAKAALAMMTRALAKDLAPRVRVNGVAPGAILWPEEHSESVIDPAVQAKILSGVPLGRLGAPADIARTVAFLVEDAPYITGQIIAVDGGRSQTLGEE
ncbi:MAG TPA: pteridine reductase [Fluviicoccus sp.]|nr:pteridine reductase [Fluviicoccus sp.]